MSKRFIHIILLLSLFSILKAQKLKFKHLTNEDGLSSALVNCIIQDSKGFMWFGTQDGLNKYDGYSFKVYRRDPENINSLSSSDVSALCQINDNLMIVGTKDGLNFYYFKTNTFERIKLGTEQDAISINKILKVSETGVVIASSKGLFLLDVSTKKTQKVKFPFQENVEVACAVKINNEVLIGTVDKGVWVLNNAKVSRIMFKNDYFHDFDINDLNDVRDIKDYAGKLYIGSYGGGVVKVDQATYEVDNVILLNAMKENNSNYVNALTITNSKMYVATKGGLGYVNLLNGDFELTSKKENPRETDLNDNTITDLCLDDQENVWLGTQLGGVNVYFSQTQKFPNDPLCHQEEFRNLYVTAQDEQKNIWLGGEKVLVSINPSTGAITRYDNIVLDNTILCFLQEDENTFYIGTYGKGLIKFDKRSRNTSTIMGTKVGGTIVSLFKDSYGNILIGTFDDGLFKYDPKTAKVDRFYAENGFDVSTVFSIYEATDKTLWLGTNRQGVYHIEAFKNSSKLKVIDKFVNNNQSNQLCANTVFCINQDNNGNYWFASESGLSMLDFKNKKFSNFYEKDGLNSGYLYSILKDSTGHLWMSSNRGIIKFNPDFKDKKPVFKNYDLKDGILNTEHFQNAFSFSKHGKMFFGGGLGYNVFSPNKIKDNYHIPNVVVTAYKRGGKEVETDTAIYLKKQLNLSWRENFFQFEVAALDYTDPTKNLYTYKLEGYDENWSEPSNIRYITYTELPGGDYILKIKASNNDGVWNDTPLELRITVVPPFWKTKWFYILLILFGAGGVYAFTQYRTQSVKRENKILETKVAERTKELEEKNRDITSSIEYAKRIQEAILPSRDYIFDRLKKAFILYKPKDIVSGDFYWFAEKEGFKIFAVVDCTGHGVPGAFMSMIGHNLLHQIVQEKGLTDPGHILDALHKGVQEALRQGHNEISTNDGMDVSIISINHEQKLFKWAGANRPLILINDQEEFTKIDGNKYPIGGAQLSVNREFTTHVIPSSRPMIAYMFSDGYADQFGGDKGKKYMVKRFHELLQENHKKDMASQRLELDKSFEQWRGNHEQVDDVLVVGIAI